MLGPIRIFISNYIRTTKLYWKFRHLIQIGIWDSYTNDYTTKRRAFYSDFVKAHSIKSIFEFGCATGTNFLAIREHLPIEDKVLYGYDISKKAIEDAKKNLNENNVYFTHKLDKSHFIQFLDDHKLEQFDLCIFDRVLCLLSNQETIKHFNTFGNYYRFVIIDDFHNLGEEIFSGTYSTKDFTKILSKFGFKLILEEDSQHLSGDDLFYQKYAKRLVFENTRVKL